ncbi:MAG: PrsW family intramembrane metalloprotease [Chloroflexi bacterium]|nr:PrsW family intramembrane metalloprotease [Chloroflexota bacterium]
MAGFAVVVGAVAFLNGLAALLLLVDLSDDPQRKLFDVNVALGTAIVTLSLGGLLVYQAASALGGVGSTAMTHRVPWALLAAFPVLIAVGQFQVDHPERLPWLFPVVNVAIVSIPSVLVAAVVARRYARFNRFAWPVSWREWLTGFIYGAIGATTVAAILNTIYFIALGAILIDTVGEGDAFHLVDNLPTLPRGWGLFYDISVLSVFAPLNEEWWKGFIVALFFFRKGSAGRCFLWGTLAGAGFNLLETFQNSLSLVHPEVVSEQTLGSRWWLFALARAGTGVMHPLATGLAALGIFGLLRRKPRYLLGYPAGVLLHGTWNFMVYVNAGDAFFSQAGPDSRALDILSVTALAAIFLMSVTLLWELPRRILDGVPAPLYRLIGMVPAGDGAREPNPSLF